MLRLSLVQEHERWLVRVHALQQLSESRAVTVMMVEMMWLLISNWQACLEQQPLRLSVAVLRKICLQQ